MSREQEACQLRRSATDVLSFAGAYVPILPVALEAQLRRTGFAMLRLADALTLRPTRFRAPRT